jgi:protein-disulfide isomerase
LATPVTSELAKTGSEGRVVLGSAIAPVTIIEYASLTCPHCAHFALKTFPKLKRRYIDTGKVRFIFKFPLDSLGAGGFILAHCAGKRRYMAVVQALFATQNKWAVEKTDRAALGDRQ